MPGGEGDQAHFQAIQPGLISQEQIEITSGVAEGDKVITTGAGALREGDRILLPGQNADARGGRSGRGRAAPDSLPAAPSRAAASDEDRGNSSKLQASSFELRR